jgi:hypothetical protein
VHVVELKVPVLLVVKVTVPVGVTAPVPEASVTVAVHVLGVLSRTLAGLQATEVDDDLIDEARVKVPLLPECTESPPYVPVMSACPTTVGVYVTLQLPEARVQVAELKVPVELVVKVTVPVGVMAPVPDESATVAVHVLGVLSRTLAGEHATVVVVVRRVEASVKLPLLPE